MDPLEYHRRMRRMKGKELAALTGYSNAYVSAVEKGKLPPSPTFRAKASGALDLPEEVLFPAI